MMIEKWFFTTSGEMNVAAISAAAVICAALVAGMIAAIGHWINRLNAKTQAIVSFQISENTRLQAEKTSRLATELSVYVKLAEMRQAWINKLREEMANFHSLCAKIGLTPGPVEYEKIYRAGTMIELHINPGDHLYQELHQTMADFVKPNMSISEKHAVNERYVAACQSILKAEWDKLASDLKRLSGTP